MRRAALGRSVALKELFAASDKTREVAGRPLDQAIAEASTLAQRLALLPFLAAFAALGETFNK